LCQDRKRTWRTGNDGGGEAGGAAHGASWTGWQGRSWPDVYIGKSMPKDEPIARASLITSHIVGIIFQCWPKKQLAI